MSECEHEWRVWNQSEAWCPKCQGSTSLNGLLRDLSAAQERERGMREALELAEHELRRHEQVDYSQCRIGYISTVRERIEAALSASPAPAPSAEPTTSAWGVFDTWQRRWCPRRGTEEEMGAHAVKLNTGTVTTHEYRYQPLPLPEAAAPPAEELTAEEWDRLANLLTALEHLPDPKTIGTSRHAHICELVPRVRALAEKARR